MTEDVEQNIDENEICDDTGCAFFELIADVDNISCDVSVSTESSVTTMR